MIHSAVDFIESKTDAVNHAKLGAQLVYYIEGLVIMKKPKMITLTEGKRKRVMSPVLDDDDNPMKIKNRGCVTFFGFRHFVTCVHVIKDFYEGIHGVNSWPKPKNPQDRFYCHADDAQSFPLRSHADGRFVTAKLLIHSDVYDIAVLRCDDENEHDLARYVYGADPTEGLEYIALVCSDN
jgi:hypothetical protein